MIEAWSPALFCMAMGHGIICIALVNRSVAERVRSVDESDLRDGTDRVVGLALGAVACCLLGAFTWALGVWVAAAPLTGADVALSMQSGIDTDQSGTVPFRVLSFLLVATAAALVVASMVMASRVRAAS